MSSISLPRRANERSAPSARSNASRLLGACIFCTLRLVIACAFCALIPVLWGCGSRNAEEDAPVVFFGETMGTTYHVTVTVDPDPDTSIVILAAIDTVLRRVDDWMSTYRPDSEISRFNDFTGSGWFAVSPETAQVISAALRVSADSAGAFDVTVGPLVDLWGFGAGKPPAAVPDEQAIALAREAAGYGKLVVSEDPPALKKEHPGLRVDLAAIAKGFGVDSIAQALDELGIESYLVEIGGEVRARGVKPDGNHWRVGIESPLDDERRVREAVELRDMSLATSGDYRRFFMAEGKRFSHTIDPRTGRPVDHALASVTIVAEDCMTADALATVMMVLGPDEGGVLAREEELAALFLIRREDGFERRATPAFDALVRNEQQRR